MPDDCARPAGRMRSACNVDANDCLLRLPRCVAASRLADPVNGQSPQSAALAAFRASCAAIASRSVRRTTA